jgi:hypothetical protein
MLFRYRGFGLIGRDLNLLATLDALRPAATTGDDRDQAALRSCDVDPPSVGRRLGLRHDCADGGFLAGSPAAVAIHHLSSCGR